VLIDEVHALAGMSRRSESDRLAGRGRLPARGDEPCRPVGVERSDASSPRSRG